MGSRELKAFCALDEPTQELLKQAMTEYNLSARAYDRILKVARTIADLAGSGKHPKRTCFRGGSISFARPAIMDLNQGARSRSSNTNSEQFAGRNVIRNVIFEKKNYCAKIEKLKNYFTDKM
jgi:hypothetical protein